MHKSYVYWAHSSKTPLPIPFFVQFLGWFLKAFSKPKSLQNYHLELDFYHVLCRSYSFQDRTIWGIQFWGGNYRPKFLSRKMCVSPSWMSKASNLLHRFRLRNDALQILHLQYVDNVILWRLSLSIVINLIKSYFQMFLDSFWNLN